MGSGNELLLHRISEKSSFPMRGQQTNKPTSYTTKPANLCRVVQIDIPKTWANSYNLITKMIVSIHWRVSRIVEYIPFEAYVSVLRNAACIYEIILSDSHSETILF